MHLKLNLLLSLIKKEKGFCFTSGSYTSCLNTINNSKTSNESNASNSQNKYFFFSDDTNVIYHLEDIVAVFQTTYL